MISVKVSVPGMYRGQGKPEDPGGEIELTFDSSGPQGGPVFMIEIKGSDTRPGKHLAMTPHEFDAFKFAFASLTAGR